MRTVEESENDQNQPFDRDEAKHKSGEWDRTMGGFGIIVKQRTGLNEALEMYYQTSH
jgi:hypothetical protein